MCCQALNDVPTTYALQRGRGEVWNETRKMVEGGEPYICHETVYSIYNREVVFMKSQSGHLNEMFRILTSHWGARYGKSHKVPSLDEEL